MLDINESKIQNNMILKVLFYSDLWAFCPLHQLNITDTTTIVQTNLWQALAEVQNKTHLFIKSSKGQVKMKSRNTFWSSPWAISNP